MRSALDRGADPNTLAYQGLNVLMVVSMQGNARGAKLLLSRGADPNRSTYYHDFTPLGWAIETKSWDTVKALLDAGADKAKEHRGRLPLDLARASSEKAIIDLLKR